MHHILNRPELLEEWTSWFRSHFMSSVGSALEQRFGNIVPQEVRETYKHIDELLEYMHAPTAGTIVHDGRTAAGQRQIQIPESFLPLIRTIVTRRYRDLAVTIEHKKSMTQHRQMLDDLEKTLVPLREYLASEALKNAPSYPVPRLIDFLTVRQVDKMMGNTEQSSDAYDEKFQILRAPTLFLRDLCVYRRRCELRGKSIAVAYVDIDDFKSLNSKYTETAVDRCVLPQFMRVLEAHVFCHGFAYRFGGDEYGIVLPNITPDAGVRSLDELRKTVAEQQYPEVSGRTTISIGMVFVHPDCYLTDLEIQKVANEAKNFAKEHGKNRIAKHEPAVSDGFVLAEATSEEES